MKAITLQYKNIINTRDNNVDARSLILVKLYINNRTKWPLKGVETTFLTIDRHRIVLNFSSPIIAGYSIAWNNKKVSVFRSDVICTNGIIHVIDRPFLEEKDIQIAYTAGASVVQATLLPSLIMLALAKIFN